MAFNDLWKITRTHSGQSFTQLKGKSFTYTAHSGYVELSSTNRNIGRGDFEKAWARRPLERVSQLQDLQGPS